MDEYIVLNFRQWVMELIQKKGNVNRILESHNVHITPLHMGALLEDVESCQLLLRYGANVFAIDEGDVSPLWAAVDVGNLDILRLFLTDIKDNYPVEAMRTIVLQNVDENCRIRQEPVGDCIPTFCVQNAVEKAFTTRLADLINVILNQVDPSFYFYNAIVNIAKEIMPPVVATALFRFHECQMSKRVPYAKFYHNIKQDDQVKKEFLDTFYSSVSNEELFFAMRSTCSTIVLNHLANQAPVEDHVLDFMYGHFLSLNPGRGDTGLHYACSLGITSHVLQFLSRGTSMWTANRFGVRPIDYIHRHPSLKDVFAKFTTDDTSLSLVSEQKSTYFLNDYRSLEDTKCVKETLAMKDGKDYLPLLKYAIETLKPPEDLKAAIQNSVTQFVDLIANELKDTKWSFSPILSGSLSEGTKCQNPDEVDILCLLSPWGKPTFKRFVNNPFARNFLHVISDTGEVIETLKFNKEFRECIEQVLQKPSFRDEVAQIVPNLYLYLSPIQSWSVKFKLPTLQLKWQDENHSLDVSLDLVPAFELPSGHPIYGNFPGVKEGLLVVPKEAKHFGSENTWRISFSRLERQKFREAPAILRDGYIMAKRIAQLCPQMWHTPFQSYVTAGSYITSYILKNCFFHISEKLLNYVKVRQNMPDETIIFSLALLTYVCLKIVLVTDGYVPLFFDHDCDATQYPDFFLKKVRKQPLSRVSQEHFNVLVAFCDRIIRMLDSVLHTGDADLFCSLSKYNSKGYSLARFHTKVFHQSRGSIYHSYGYSLAGFFIKKEKIRIVRKILKNALVEDSSLHIFYHKESVRKF